METPDPWQVKLLAALVTRRENTLSICSRQVGKTKSNSLAAYVVGALGGFCLILSPSKEQSLEFFDGVLQWHKKHELVEAVGDPRKSEIRFKNGGRIKCLPNNEKTVRIYSAVDLLIFDEASRVPDALFNATTPMMAVSKGRVGALTTPYGKRGWAYHEWTKNRDDWTPFMIPWHKCPRLTEEFIRKERNRMTDLWVAQEYECQFLDQAQGAVFDLAKFEDLVDWELVAEVI
jgi:hypothetical protein